MPRVDITIDLDESSTKKNREALRDVSNKLSKYTKNEKNYGKDSIIHRDRKIKPIKSSVRTRSSTRTSRSNGSWITNATNEPGQASSRLNEAQIESARNQSKLEKNVQIQRSIGLTSKVDKEQNEPISNRTRLKRRRSLDRNDESESHVQKNVKVKCKPPRQTNVGASGVESWKRRKISASIRPRPGLKSSTFKEVGKKVVGSEPGRIVPNHFELERSANTKDHTLGIAPHDEKDLESIKQVATYVTDILQNLYQAELISRPRLYMEKQSDINSKMRAILVDWLVEVHMKFRLVPETLYLSINIIDRYCSLVVIKRSRLQLVGVTALLLACKYEEIYPPEVRDCVYITDKAYQKQEVLDMEQDIVHRLRFKITVPTAYPFLQRFLNIVQTTNLVKFATCYYTERTLQEHDMLAFKPSLITASSLVLALNNSDLRKKDEETNIVPCGIPPILLEYTGFQEKEILACAAQVAKKVGEEPVTASKRLLASVKRKYSSRKFLHVSVKVDVPSIESVLATL